MQDVTGGLQFRPASRCRFRRPSGRPERGSSAPAKARDPSGSSRRPSTACKAALRRARLSNPVLPEGSGLQRSAIRSDIERSVRRLRSVWRALVPPAGAPPPAAAPTPRQAAAAAPAAGPCAAPCGATGSGRSHRRRAAAIDAPVEPVPRHHRDPRRDHVAVAAGEALRRHRAALLGQGQHRRDPRRLDRGSSRDGVMAEIALRRRH